MAQCQTCRGSRYVWRSDEFSAGFYPCPRCGGTAEESCCDGEDRWQIEKLDKDQSRVDEPIRPSDRKDVV